MTLQQAIALVPWWVKAGVAALLVLLTISECRARDRAIARAALWQVSWDSTVAAKKLTDDQLKAAKDTARLLVAQATKEKADFEALLAHLKTQRQKVVVVHDTTTPVTSLDTMQVTDLPVVKACTRAVDTLSAALSKCQLVQIIMGEQHAQDSIQLRLAFRKPQVSSRARDMETGAAVGITITMIVLHFLHAHF